MFVPSWRNASARFVSSSTDSHGILEFLRSETASSSSEWLQLASEAIKNPAFNSDYELLSTHFVLNHPNWSDLAQQFINGDSGDSEKAAFLSSLYIQQKQEWRSMVERFIKDESVDLEARIRLLRRPEVESLGLSLTRSNN